MVDEYTVLVETTDDVDVRKMSHPPKILGKCNMILYVSNIKPAFIRNHSFIFLLTHAHSVFIKVRYQSWLSVGYSSLDSFFWSALQKKI